MSKTIQYDSLLVRALAAALADRYRGARVRAIRFDSELRTVRVSLPKRALVWNLDPNGGGIWQEPDRGPATGIMLPRGTHVAAIRAAPDERIIEWLLRTGGGEEARTSRLWIELLPNRRNAILTADDHRVLGSLTAVASEGGGNVHWTPPEGRPRLGWNALPDEEAFIATLGDTEPAGRRRKLMSTFAWTGPVNAESILGEAAERNDDQALREAFERYTAIVGRARPGIIEPGTLDQPYPNALPGRAFQETDDLMAAFEEVAPMHRTQPAEVDPADVVHTLERLRDSERGRIAKLRSELDGAGREAERLRAHADLLLGQLHLARRGMDSVELDDWNGGRVTVQLDASLDPAGNANRMYDRARKRERAAERLPALIARARAKLGRLEDALRRLSDDPTAVDDVASLIPPAGPARRKARQRPSLPYRRYRTSGGLEVRVGRGSRANDELTLRHSSPEDIWLHARDVAGAHVVLLWGRREDNPPARDLAEAAVLAALNSRARTSGTVPVDWTRRKYVRKPRKSRPGMVTLERARTVFVQPDPAVEERLRET